jgi:hypothetical protein
MNRRKYIGSRKRLYWQRRFAAEEANNMLRRNDEAVSATATRYVVRVRRTIGGRIYNVGSGITAAECGPNFRAMLNNHDIEPAQDGVALNGSVVDLPAAEPPKPRPAAVIVHDADALAAWDKPTPQNRVVA